MLLKPDFLKIDGAIIQNLPDSYFSQIIVKNIIKMSKDLNIKTVAEYVSDEKIYSECKELGVDFFQGYFIGKPANCILKRSEIESISC